MDYIFPQVVSFEVAFQSGNIYSIDIRTPGSDIPTMLLHIGYLHSLDFTCIIVFLRDLFQFHPSLYDF